MLNSMQRSFAYSFLILLCFSFIFINTNTQNNSRDRGIIISPSIIELDVDRGKNYEVEIEIENDNQGNQSYELQRLTQTFQASENEGVPELREFNSSDPHKDWVNYPEPVFAIKDDERKTTQAILSIPKDANPGSYYFALIFGTDNKDTNNQNKVVINQRISSLLFVNVSGKIQREISIQNFEAKNETSSSSFYDPFFDPIEINYKIGVSGNTYLKPSGNIFFYQNKDNPQTTIQLNPENRIILPNSSRSFDLFSKPQFLVNWLSGNPAGLDKIKDKNNTELSRPWFGSQTIEIRVLFANSDGDLEIKSIKKEIFFFPWKLLLIILIISAILAVIYLFFKRRTNKNKQKRNVTSQPSS